MNALLADPSFYAVAVPAVMLVGLSKGGFGGAMGFVGVPLMALVMSPVQAAAILLPILVLMDIVSLWTWRGVYDRRILRHHAARLDGRHCCRLADGGDGDGRHGAPHRRRGGDRLRVRWLYLQVPARRRPCHQAEAHRRRLLGHRGGLHQLRRACRRPALPDLHAAAADGSEGTTPAPA